jgi:hypothetical protein
MKNYSQAWFTKEYFDAHPQLSSLTILIFSTLLGTCLSPLLQFLDDSHQNLWMITLVGGIALGLSAYFRLPSWWVLINGAFPFCIYLFSNIDIPRSAYLVALIIFLGIYWNTLIRRVPYYPSNRLVWQEVENLFPKEGSFKVLEIGSGLGGFSRTLSKRHPSAHFIGLETAPFPWICSWVLAKIQQAPCQLRWKDYQQESFANYDFIFAFLSPAAMTNLYHQSNRELRHGAQMISYMFSWPIESQKQVTPIALTTGEFLYVLKRTPTL